MSGLIFLAAAIGMYVLEFCWKREYIAGAVGALLLAAAFLRFGSGQNRIAILLLISLGLILGVAIAVLCYVAKRARLNKIADL